MSFGNTNISQLAVACAVGENVTISGVNYLDTRLSVLCTSNRVNKYSRYRPGYWCVGTDQYLYFQKPRGNSYTDPRNTSEKETFKLGDFRGYDPTAYAPGIGGGGSSAIVFPSSDDGATKTVECVLNLGEVDWFNEETELRGRNNIPTYSQVVVENADNNAVMTYINKADLETSGFYKRAVLSIPVLVTSGRVYNFRFGLGYANKAYAYFHDTLQLTIQVVTAPRYIIRIPETALAALKSSIIQGLALEDASNSIYEVFATGGGGTFNAGSVNLNETVSFAMQMQGSYNMYGLTTLRWSVGYEMSVYDALAGTTTNYTGSFVLASSGIDAASHGAMYQISLSLPITAADGDIFTVNLTSFTNTKVSEIIN